MPIVASEYSPSGQVLIDSSVPVRPEQPARKRQWLSRADVLKKFQWTDDQLRIAQSLHASTCRFPAVSRIDDSRSLTGVSVGALTTWRMRFGSRPVDGWYEDEIVNWMSALRADVIQLGIVK